MVCFAFACLLTCEYGHFACLIFKPFSFSTLPLLSIGFGQYSNDWVQCDSAFGGWLLAGFPWIPPSLCSFIVDEFKETVALH